MPEPPTDDPLFDYDVYRFGRGRLLFRGPQPDLRGHYLCFLGSAHTFGRFTDAPFPALVAEKLGMTGVNLGTAGAGPGFFLGDREVLHVASGADLCVVQAMCATATSNRMFTVRSRRNIRLDDVSTLLRGLYPEIDFRRFVYVRPMLRHLREIDAARFGIVRSELMNAWVARMQSLLSAVERPAVLLWLSQRAPEEEAFDEEDGGAGYPYFVDRAMLDEVRGAAAGYAEVTSRRGLPQDLRVAGRAVLRDRDGEPRAENRRFPSPEMHREAAEALNPEISRLLGR